MKLLLLIGVQDSTMTASEVVYMVRSYLDDGINWRVGQSELNWAINEAQDKLIEMGYSSQDERMLRPLYTSSFFLQTNTPISGAASGEFMYARGCKIWEDVTAQSGITFGQTAEYVSHPTYLNYVFPDFGSGYIFPRQAVYTITKDTVAGTSLAYLQFNHAGANARAKLWYIARPPRFNYDKVWRAFDQGLSIPEEYHIYVCNLAAELLNSNDVGETERSTFSPPETRIPFEGIM